MLKHRLKYRLKRRLGRGKDFIPNSSRFWIFTSCCWLFGPELDAGIRVLGISETWMADPAPARTMTLFTSGNINAPHLSLRVPLRVPWRGLRHSARLFVRHRLRTCRTRALRHRPRRLRLSL